MAIDERTRHALHQRLDEVLGADEAATLMAHLPPTGWGDVVTREYLDMAFQAQDARLEARFTHIDAYSGSWRPRSTRCATSCSRRLVANWWRRWRSRPGR